MRKSKHSASQPVLLLAASRVFTSSSSLLNQSLTTLLYKKSVHPFAIDVRAQVRNKSLHPVWRKNIAMKRLKSTVFLVLVSTLMLGQSSSPGTRSVPDTSRISNQIQALQNAIAQQQTQIEMLRNELAEQKNANRAPQVVNASLSTSGASNTLAGQSDVEKPKESPLSFRIAGADFTPGAVL